MPHMPGLGVALSFWSEWHGGGEPELHLVRALADPGRLSIDIGANWGMYSRAMLPVSRQVIAFEPNPVEAARLRRALPRLRVEACALGAEPGEAMLRVPVMANGASASGFGTIGDFAMPFDREAGVGVPVRTLDSFAFADVGLIKIDVEGFEYRVLEGAMDTIERCRPNLLIELNGGPERMAALLEPLGYRGFYLEEGERMPTTCWSPDLRSRHGYPPNNFVFATRPAFAHGSIDP